MFAQEPMPQSRRRANSFTRQALLPPLHSRGTLNRQPPCRFQMRPILVVVVAPNTAAAWTAARPNSRPTIPANVLAGSHSSLMVIVLRRPLSPSPLRRRATIPAKSSTRLTTTATTSFRADTRNICVCMCVCACVCLCVYVCTAGRGQCQQRAHAVHNAKARFCRNVDNATECCQLCHHNVRNYLISLSAPIFIESH